MAFMMPVMKNEFDIYKSGRSRRISECSNNGSACRSRKVSESRSECPSLSTSPGNEFVVGSPSHRTPHYQMQRNSSRAFSRTSSRASQNSMSPTKGSQSTSPPKSSTNNGSQGSLNKFHTRLVDKLRKALRKDSSTDRS